MNNWHLLEAPESLGNYPCAVRNCSAAPAALDGSRILFAFIQVDMMLLPLLPLNSRLQINQGASKCHMHVCSGPSVSVHTRASMPQISALE